MAASLVPLLHHLRRLSGVESESDAARLDRFARLGDQRAFAALVDKHGPMVLRVCRRVLGDAQAAEDATQATFLVLARKATAIGRTDALAGWLHGVARRVALKARAGLAPRGQPLRAADVPADKHSDPLADLSVRELLAIIDEEVDRLPSEYRLPVLLCCLEGISQDEAARRLGWTPGSVKGRLERGRKRLHARLARRGIVPAAAFAAMEVCRAAATAALPAGLASATIQAAVTFAGGPGVIGPASTEAARLAAKILGGAGTGNLKLGLALLLVLGLTAFGASALTQRTPGEPPAPSNAVGEPIVSPVEPKERVDRLGDPLPAGALLRLGTLRHRDISGMFGTRLLLSDGKTLLFSGPNDVRAELHWMDTTTGRITESWPAPKGLTACGFAPDGRLALFAGDTTLRLWDLTTRKEVRAFESKGKLNGQVNAAFAPDGHVVVTTISANGTPGLVRVWDVKIGRQLWELGKWGAFTGQFMAGFLPDGQTLVFLDHANNRVSLRDRMTGRVLRSFDTMPTAESRSSGLSPDGKALLMGTSGPSVRVWDIATGEERAPLGGHKGQAHTFGFGRDGRTVLTGGQDSFVLVWDWPTGKLRRKIDLKERGAGNLAVSVDGKRAEITTSPESVPQWFDLETGKELPRLAEAHNGPVWGIAIAPDGRLVSAGYDTMFRVWDLDSGRQLHEHPTEDSMGAYSLALSADGRLVATGEYNHGTIRVHERDTGRLVRAIKTSGNSMTGVAFAPTGGQLLAIGVRADQTGSGASDRFVGLWDVKTGKEMRRFEGGAGPVFSPDGRLLAAFVDQRPKLWDVETGLEMPLEAAKCHGELTFSPDGRLLAANEADNIVLWEIASGQVCCRIDPGVNGFQDRLRFSPDGRRIARSNGGGVQLFDALGGRHIHSFIGHLRSVTKLAFTPDGRRLASASYDTTVLIWDVAGTVGPVKSDGRPDAVAVTAAWGDLAGADAKAVYRAIGLLVEAPAQAVPFLRQRLKPAAVVVQPKQVQNWIEELDSDEFATRAAASEKLENAGGPAEQGIRQALSAGPSLEARRRLEGILKKLRGVPAPETLRVLRAVQALELIGSPEAQAALETLAGGAAGAWETRHAQAALARLKKRAASAPGG